jgi:outer membrane protein
MYEQMKDRLMSEKEVAERNFERKVKELEKDYKELQEMAPFMSRSEGQKKQQELMQREQELYKLQEELSMDLGDSERKKTEEMQKAVVEYINEFNETEGYNIILSKSVLGDVIHADSTFDITQQILDGLNEKYAKK